MFIAMVLVAAIAAGVLINTAGFLQTKSEETGQQSGQQVTNRLQIAGATGEHLQNSAVGVVNVTLKKSPGASNIDLENATVQWVGPSGTYNLVNQSVSASGAEDHFGIVAFKDADDSRPVLNDPDDRMVISFEIGYTNISLDNYNGTTGTGDGFFGVGSPKGPRSTSSSRPSRARPRPNSCPFPRPSRVPKPFNCNDRRPIFDTFATASHAFPDGTPAARLASHGTPRRSAQRLAAVSPRGVRRRGRPLRRR